MDYRYFTDCCVSVLISLLVYVYVCSGNEIT